jgi:hypothetical protein
MSDMPNINPHIRHNPHPNVMKTPPKSLYGESETDTLGLAPYYSPPDAMVPF